MEQPIKQIPPQLQPVAYGIIQFGKNAPEQVFAAELKNPFRGNQVLLFGSYPAATLKSLAVGLVEYLALDLPFHVMLPSVSPEDFVSKALHFPKDPRGRVELICEPFNREIVPRGSGWGGFIEMRAGSPGQQLKMRWSGPVAGVVLLGERAL